MFARGCVLSFPPASPAPALPARLSRRYPKGSGGTERKAYSRGSRPHSWSRAVRQRCSRASRPVVSVSVRSWLFIPWYTLFKTWPSLTDSAEKAAASGPSCVPAGPLFLLPALRCARQGKKDSRLFFVVRRERGKGY